MEFSTTTSTIIQDFILSVLIVISDIVFRWIPAAMTVITGQPPAFLGMQSGSDTAARITQSLSQKMTQVQVEGTLIADSGVQTAVPVDGSIQAIQAVPAATQVQAIPFLSDTLQTAWHIFAPLSIFISLLLAMGLVYSLIRFFQIRFAESHALHAMMEPVVVASATGGIPSTGPTDAEKRWRRIEEQIASPIENDWRLAILEADIMLGDVLNVRGYIGDSIGEQLKGLTRGDLATLDQAWDAHKVRNHIAHRGTMHDINQREAKRVITEYEQVFRELKLI